MACCLTAPSHYLNQCWLNIRVALWHSVENDFTRNAQDIYPWYQFENYWFKTSTASSRGQWVNNFQYPTKYGDLVSSLPRILTFMMINLQWSNHGQICLTHWPLGIWLQSQISKFQTHFNDKYLKYFQWNCYQVNATIPHGSLVNIGSDNGMVPSGNKPLPEPVLT